MKTIKIILKFIILPIILVVAFNMFEYGFVWDKVDKFLYPFVLAAVSMIIFFIPGVRRFFLMIAFGMLILMVLLYLSNNPNLSNFIGSFGFALLLIVILSLLPQLIQKGQIEKY
mgnify:FL=1